jgi:hypothetical protein
MSGVWNAYTFPRTQNPPGWGEAIDNGLDLHRVIEASVDHWEKDGFGVGPHAEPAGEMTKGGNQVPGFLDWGTKWTEFLSTDIGATADAIDKAPYSPFNIPICRLDTPDKIKLKEGKEVEKQYRIEGLDDFFKTLSQPRYVRSNGSAISQR